MSALMKSIRKEGVVITFIGVSFLSALLLESVVVSGIPMTPFVTGESHTKSARQFCGRYSDAKGSRDSIIIGTPRDVCLFAYDGGAINDYCKNLSTVPLRKACFDGLNLGIKRGGSPCSKRDFDFGDNKIALDICDSVYKNMVFLGKGWPKDGCETFYKNSDWLGPCIKSVEFYYADHPDESLYDEVSVDKALPKEASTSETLPKNIIESQNNSHNQKYKFLNVSNSEESGRYVYEDVENQYGIDKKTRNVAFEPHEPIYYAPSGDVWVEGYIDVQTIRTEKNTETGKFENTPFDAYGYYKYIDYCSTYIPPFNQTKPVVLDQAEKGASQTYYTWLNNQPSVWDGQYDSWLANQIKIGGVDPNNTSESYDKFQIEQGSAELKACLAGQVLKALSDKKDNFGEIPYGSQYDPDSYKNYADKVREVFSDGDSNNPMADNKDLTTLAGWSKTTPDGKNVCDYVEYSAFTSGPLDDGRQGSYAYTTSGGEGAANYLQKAACQDGIDHPITPDTYFVVGETTITDGSREKSDTSNVGGGGGNTGDNSNNKSDNDKKKDLEGTIEEEPSEPAGPDMCDIAGKEKLKADDPNCKEDPPAVEKCDVSGKEDLNLDDPNCVTSFDPENPSEIIEPCDIIAAASGSSYYKTEATDATNVVSDVSIKKAIWDLLSDSRLNLTKEQIAAIMGNIQGESNFNPASVKKEIALDGTEQQQGLGLIHWSPYRAINLIKKFEQNDVFSPFFDADKWGIYGDSANTNGDDFLNIAAENKVLKKANDLLVLEIQELVNDLEGYLISKHTDIVDATDFVYRNLILTTNDTSTPAPEVYVQYAEGILDGFGNDPGETDPTAPIDPTCDADGNRRVPAGLTSDLLAVIDSSVKSKILYQNALDNSGIFDDGKNTFAFVAAMMRSSDFHKNYPVASAADVPLLDRMPTAWTQVIKAKSLTDIKDSELKVGDVLASVNASQTMIFVGRQSFNGDKPFALAVTNFRYPFYADKTVDQLNAYNVYRRQIEPTTSGALNGVGE